MKAIWDATGKVEYFLNSFEGLYREDLSQSAQANAHLAHANAQSAQTNASLQRQSASLDRMSDFTEQAALHLVHACQLLVSLRHNLETRVNDGIVFAGNLDFRSRPEVLSRLATLRERQTDIDESLTYSLDKVVRSISISEEVEQENCNVVVASLAIGNSYIGAVKQCLDSHAAFAERHGYLYRLMREEPTFLARPPAWLKVPLIVNLLRKSIPYVFYVDADAMFTNLEEDIDDLIHELNISGACISVVEDEDGINAGVMIVKNCVQAVQIFELVWLYDAYLNQGTWEQHALKYLIESFPEVRRQVLIIDNAKRLNSFAPERNEFHKTKRRNTWTEGDMICHFSGIRQPYLQQFINRYADRSPVQ